MNYGLLESGVREFFRFAIRRELVRRSKAEGLPRPWTKDPVLQQFYFCNVFREHDRTTAWFRENIREPLRNSPGVVMATIAFRWFNRIETGEWIKDSLLEDPTDIDRLYRILRQKRDENEQLFTGAYIIKSPNGVNKLTGIADCLRAAVRWYVEWQDSSDSRDQASLRSFHTWLQTIPYLGPFMAYEVVTDLRHTKWLENAPDIMTWASAGPGAARGLSYLIPGGVVLPYSSDRGQETMLALMRNLLQLSGQYWPNAQFGKWEMREVEHTLCEFDKYKRGVAGERLKRRYGQ